MTLPLASTVTLIAASALGAGPWVTAPVEGLYSAPWQGQINFFTFNAQNGNLGHVFKDPAKTMGLDGSYFGQLLGGTTASSLSPIGAPVSFLSGAAAGIINSGIVAITGTNPGETYFYALAAWASAGGATYAAALAFLTFLAVSMTGLLLRALWTGEWYGALFLVGFAVLFTWQIGGFVRRNRPRSYSFDQLPEALLP